MLVVPAVVLLAGIGSVGGRVGLTAAHAGAQRATDRAAIDDLLWRYVRALGQADRQLTPAVRPTPPGRYRGEDGRGRRY